MRTVRSFDHVDYDLGFGVTFPAAVRGNDLFNSGETTAPSHIQHGLVFLDLAANLQIGRWGVGASVDFQQYQLARGSQSLGLSARFGGLRLQVARAFADGQLLLGVGSRGTGLVVENEQPAAGQPKQLFNIEGANTELGALIRPNDQPFRLGASLRSAVITNQLDSRVAKNAAGDRVLTIAGKSVYLPNEVALPWDANVGFAIQLGPRPLNPRWIDPEEALARLERTLRYRELERERRRRAASEKYTGASRAAALAGLDADLASEAALDALHRERAELALRDKLKRRYHEMDRFYVLIAGSLLVTGPVQNAVGVESFLQQQVSRSGQFTTVSPRLGLETEIWPRRAVIRGGSYVEPTRFTTQTAKMRVHGTGGFDVKLFPWTVFGVFDEETEWRLSTALDASWSYFSWGASVGVWH